MKKFFITVLLAGLFVTVNSVWAQNNTQKGKAPAKVENTAKACCAAKAGDTKTSETKACCTAKAGDTKACSAEKKECCNASTAKAGETKACCAEKTGKVATACTNSGATAETKSSGKKTN